MGFLLTIVMLLFWAVSGFNRIDMLVASVIFYGLWIGEMAVSEKIKQRKTLLESMNIFRKFAGKEDK